MFHPVRSTLYSLFFVFVSATVYSQTSIDDVHITPRTSSIEPRTSSIELASAAPGPGIARALIRTSADLVMVPVTITDDLNRPVTGLDRDNFEVFENKKQQTIKNFSSEDTPVSIGIILDVSGSMGEKLERARDAIRQFCDEANPQDEFFAITFADTPQLATGFTNRPEEVENALLTVRSKGRTSLLDAIYMGIKKMKEARYSRHALLILSDGGDNHSRFSEHEVKNAVKEADILIYSVGTYEKYVSTQEELLGPELLESVSDVTGGQAYTLSNEAELPAVTRSIGTRLRHQYVLTYRPPAPQRDGKWHKIVVKLRVPKKWPSLLRVTARSGYYANQE